MTSCLTLSRGTGRLYFVLGLRRLDDLSGARSPSLEGSVVSVGGESSVHAFWVKDPHAPWQSASGRSKFEVWATLERRATVKEEPNVVVLLAGSSGPV